MNRRGVTLIEVLVTVVIGAIAMFALAAPLLAQGSFFRKGKRQTEAQRDAQVVLRAMGVAAREGTGYSTASGRVDFLNTSVCGTNPVRFELHAGGVFHMHCAGNTVTLIDGVRSQVTSFTATPVVSNKLVRIQLGVSHRLRTTDPSTENETLETELFLRNGT